MWEGGGGKREEDKRRREEKGRHQYFNYSLLAIIGIVNVEMKVRLHNFRSRNKSDQGAGSREQGAGSREKGAGSREQRAGIR